jgi:hypothetical protein
MITFELMFTEQADKDITDLEKNASLKKRLKAVRKALGYLQINPRHPSLNTHKFSSLQGELREEVFEAYAENNTPAAYRIFWHYGPGKENITIIAITAHP